MVAFIPKKLSPESNCGEKLRQARRFKELKIETISKKLNIRADYLIALEEERYDQLPAGLYGKNFLREYANFLGLNPKEFLLDQQTKINTNFTDNPFSQPIVKRRKFLIFPKIIRNILISLAILICFLYLIFYFKKIILPPDLTITQPPKNLLIKENVITIAGQTAPEAEVKINGELVLNNHNGSFSQLVNLKKGLNNIVIKAKKKYSQEQIVTRQILVE
ncbi:MAG: helix-turn-helix domain-containing protein [Patescibacteria group bacterium]|jgi:cytoskeletal protein RodZ